LLAVGALCQFGVAQAKPSNLPSAQDVITFLNQSIDWHHQLAVEEQIAADPGDMLYVNDNRQTANQILRLAFEFARAGSQLLSSRGTAETQPVAAGRYASLARAAHDADAEVKQTRAELESNKSSLPGARGSRRKKLLAEIDELQSELNLAQSRSKNLHDILQFVSGASGIGSSLSQQIDQLERSLPELEAGGVKSTNAQTKASASDSTAAGTPAALTTNRRSQPSGILGLAEELFSITHRINTIDRRMQATDALAQSSQKLHAPVLADLVAISQRGEEAAKQADVSGPDQLKQLKQELDALNVNFEQESTVALPLAKQKILFNVYQSNLARWRSAVKSEYSANLQRLLLRLVIFGIVIAVVIALSRMWQRAVFRYIHDPRRRYQFLLLRRIIVWCAIALTIAFALATQIGSIATFAGLITAGIAVALQNVILAIAGYFFLIGKYGVRVGDRIQISGVTGDVIDIGLIRLHMMEVGGAESDRQPTGRVVAFSNAVVFQPTASLFRQIPGTSFVLHQVSLVLAPESDYTLAEKRLLNAVEKVYAGYRERIERQHSEMERILGIVVPTPKPRSFLRLTQTGLEVVIRYPVEIESAGEIDDRIIRELLRSLEEPPKLKLVGTGIPNIQPVRDETKAA
jgi:small-conductance mechanosensitive channel